MVGTNYESSDGDFKYKNYAAERYLPYGEQQIAGQQKVIDNFNNETIDYMTKGAVINLQQEQIDYYKANNMTTGMNMRKKMSAIPICI